MYTKIYNDCFPLKKATRKQRRFKKTWLTKALLKSIKIKNQLCQKYLQVSTVDGVSLYKRYKNELNHTLCLAKRRNYDKNWKKIAKVSNTISKSDNQEISVLVEVANKFCSYFCSIGPNLPKKRQPPPSSHKDFLFESFRESIFFSPTTEDGSKKSKPYAENSKGCQIHPHCNSPYNLDSRQCRLLVI